MKEETFYHEIYKLQSMGINAADIAKLKQAGINTLLSPCARARTCSTSKESLMPNKADKIYEAALKIECRGFITGMDVVQKILKVKKIATGSKILNTLLGGGIKTIAITVRIGNTIAVTAQWRLTDGGGQRKVLYIDTEGTFRPERITKLQKNMGLILMEYWEISSMQGQI